MDLSTLSIEAIPYEIQGQPRGQLKIVDTKLCILDIPPELRIAIYEYALVPSGYICTCIKSELKVHGSGCYCHESMAIGPNYMYDADWVDDQHNFCRYEDKNYQAHMRTAHPSLALGLLRTSRLISREALDVFLTLNTFIVDLDPGPHSIGLHIPAWVLEKIRRVFIVASTDNSRGWDLAVATFPCMTSLEHIRFTALWHEETGRPKGWVHPRTGHVSEGVTSCDSALLLAKLLDNVSQFQNIALGSDLEAEKAFVAARCQPDSQNDRHIEPNGYWGEARLELLENDMRAAREQGRAWLRTLGERAVQTDTRVSSSSAQK